jgi:hypothetical protein
MEEEENENFYNYEEAYEMTKLTWVQKRKTRARKAASSSTEIE